MQFKDPKELAKILIWISLLKQKPVQQCDWKDSLQVSGYNYLHPFVWETASHEVRLQRWNSSLRPG